MEKKYHTDKLMKIKLLRVDFSLFLFLCWWFRFSIFCHWIPRSRRKLLKDCNWEKNRRKNHQKTVWRLTEALLLSKSYFSPLKRKSWPGALLVTHRLHSRSHEVFCKFKHYFKYMIFCCRERLHGAFANSD